MGQTAKGRHSYEMVWCGKYIESDQKNNKNQNGVERVS